MSAAELIAMAERVEAATGPDRELDRVIFALVKPDAFTDDLEAAQYADPSYRGNAADWRYLSEVGGRRYTASLDAAMTLVPEGWVEGYRRRLDGPVLADCYNRDWDKQTASLAATPALALTAASLRARAASEASL